MNKYKNMHVFEDMLKKWLKTEQTSITLKRTLSKEEKHKRQMQKNKHNCGKYHYYIGNK